MAGEHQSSPANTFLSIFGLNKAVVAVFSLIYDAGLFGYRIVEYEECVPEKIHLHDSLLRRHGSVFKGLGSDNDLVVLLLLAITYRCRRDRFVGYQSLT